MFIINWIFNQFPNTNSPKKITITTIDFTTTIVVNQTPKEVFNAINNPRGWWSEEIEGSTEKLNDEFNYHYKDVHTAKMKLIEVIPNKKVVWLVMNNHFNLRKTRVNGQAHKSVLKFLKRITKRKSISHIWAWFH